MPPPPLDATTTASTSVVSAALDYATGTLP